MRRKVFIVHDTKSGIYSPPMLQITHGEAERLFKTWANDKQSKIGLYPEDHDLYYSGEFDDCTGTFELLPSPQHVIKAINCLTQ